jgi:hypothetical protein
MRPTVFSTIIISIAGSVFLLSATAFGLGVWKVASLRETADAARAKAADDAAKALVLRKQVSFASKSAAIREQVDSLAIPVSGDAAFISNVETLASSQHVDVSVSSVSATGPSKSGEPGTLSLVLQLSGSYVACMRVLQLLETLPVAVSVPQVQLSYDSKLGSWSGSISLIALSYDSP